MLASREHAWELSWWALVGLLALLLVALASQTALYGEPGARPSASPAVSNMSADDVTDAWCQGVEAYRNREFARAQQAFDGIARAQEGGIGDPALQVWQTLAAHARGDRIDAVRGWRMAALELNAEVWRHVGLAAIALDKGQLDDANKALDNAWELDRNNPVVRYQTALLNLERSHRANVWEDKPEFPFRLALLRVISVSRPIVTPNTPAMYRLAAIADLERAVDLAPQLAFDVPLIATESQAAVLAPRVGDLLQAIGATDLEATSQLMLGQLFLEQDNPRKAEQHFDAAAALGRTAPFGYQEVAAEYQHQNRFCEAAMASGKAFRASPDRTTGGPLVANILRSVGQFMAR